MSVSVPAAAVGKPELYRELLAALDALTAGEPDGIANMANAAALVFAMLPELNWAGFYRVIDGELVLGPFQGRPACIRIALGQGVCGTSALRGDAICVAERPCLSRPHRLRRSLGVGAGRADPGGWPYGRRARPGQPATGPVRHRRRRGL